MPRRRRPLGGPTPPMPGTGLPRAASTSTAVGSLRPKAPDTARHALPPRRARAHGLRTLSCRLAGPVQPQGARPGLPRALRPLRPDRPRRGLDPLPALPQGAAARRAGQVASQSGRGLRPRRLRTLHEAASRPRVQLLHGLPRGPPRLPPPPLPYGDPGAPVCRALSTLRSTRARTLHAGVRSPDTATGGGRPRPRLQGNVSAQHLRLPVLDRQDPA